MTSGFWILYSCVCWGQENHVGAFRLWAGASSSITPPSSAGTFAKSVGEFPKRKAKRHRPKRGLKMGC